MTAMSRTRTAKPNTDAKMMKEVLCNRLRKSSVSPLHAVAVPEADAVPDAVPVPEAVPVLDAAAVLYGTKDTAKEDPVSGPATHQQELVCPAASLGLDTL
jgi:hypothetical protein